ncbi:putative docking protein 2 [Apostichopus japonicus]|uniref:Putative docking protein 2 n=1 Tax=Stichopus japonicus TaxID=307972 RepID=A0A2G8KNG2_STIJA|nr:putative docking protein 2 [Apostichopus japonicus]
MSISLLNFSLQRGDNWKKCSAKLIETENDGLLKLECETDKTLTYSMQTCSRVLEAGSRYSRDNVIELLLQKKIVQLCFDTQDDSVEWLRVLSSYSKDSLSHANAASKTRQNSDHKTIDSATAISPGMEYNVAYELDSTIPPLDVTIRTSPLAEKLNLRGKFFLVIGDDQLTIFSAENKTISFSWEYKTIRKYGRDKKSFSMEVGRRSHTGPGVLVFNTVYGNDIFHRVQKNTLAINSQPPATAPSAPPANQVPTKSASVERSDLRKGRNSKDGLKNNFLHSSAGMPVLDSEYSTIEDSLAARGRREKPSAPRAPEELQYCKAEEITEDAWKKHGRVEENVHTEYYIGVQKPKTSKKPSLKGKSLPANQIYGQINRKRNQPAPRVDLQESDPGVYSSLGQSGISQHPQHVPTDTSECTYDHLARPMANPSNQSAAAFSNPSGSFSDKRIITNNGDEYDHLQRGMTSPQPQEGEELYNVIGQSNPTDKGGQRLINLVDDGSGYMTNAGTAPPVPLENEYDMAVPHGYS